MIQEQMILSCDDAILIQKSLHRMANVVQDHLQSKNAATSVVFSQSNKGLSSGASLMLAPLKPAEVSRLIEIVSQLGILINDHKAAAREDLLALGEHGFLDGDGILRIPDGDGYDEAEYRVFVQGTIGTEYAGTYPNVHKAKEVWFNTKTAKGMPANEVDVYVWEKIQKPTGEVIWTTAIWAELGVEADNFFNAQTRLTQISDDGYGESVKVDGDLRRID